MQSILVVRLSSLGDVLLTTPLVRWLRARYPNATIDVAVAERFAEVYASNPHVSTVVKIQPDQRTWQHTRRSYDVVLDLQNNNRSHSLTKALSTAIRRYPKHRLEKLALVYLKRKPVITTHVVQRYATTLHGLDVQQDDLGLEVFVNGRKAEQNPNAHAIGIAPGAHHFTKRWPTEKFAAVAQTLLQASTPIVLLGGPAEVELCNTIHEACKGLTTRADGATTLAQTIDALQNCTTVITNDSGVMHLAAACGVPIVAVFGSTVKELGFTPYGIPYRIVEQDVVCRPCSHIGRGSCPKGHFNCMNLISVEQVVGEVES